MAAMLNQISPQVALRNFQKIATHSAMVSTSIPGSEVGRFLALALKAKDQKIATLSLVPPLVNTGDPDIDEVHDLVKLAIDRAEGDAPPAETPKKKRRTETGTTGGSIGSMAEGYAANQSADLGGSC